MMRSLPAPVARLLQADWLPALIGALAIWIATAVIAGHGLFGTLEQSVVVASFLALVGFGEIAVISLGRGHIDLSVPYALTLAAYLSARIMDGADSMLLPAIAVTIALGIVIGAVNYAVIRWLEIPPLVATLAVGFVLQTGVQLVATYGAKLPSPLLMTFATARVAGLSLLGLLVIFIGVLMYIVLSRSAYGRRILALGQSAEAARLSGVRVERVEIGAYVLCAVASTVCGLILGAYASGPSLDMAGQYQMGAIAVVVLGGSAIGGGRSNVPGVWFAALLLTLLSTLVAVMGAGAGVQHIVEGLVIVGVLAIVPKRGR